jgi:hypothetical protein
MADTEVRIGSGGTFLRSHGVEPESQMTLRRQELSGANLVTTIGA